ncbi:sugar-binding transcriptional regulator [Neogemmobacter tilapiae]|uniref:Transcriptional regulator n=1 Tax=Neogemmobacter tilapiae TaxID=875041 RepID=A0A918WNW2_9RHOB|nr:sugar-binding transcriptional regulator [Gemmobacter tilapiae]GHC60372.1 transcriptional regulator [Gemmobacter tilapiae]
MNDVSNDFTSMRQMHAVLVRHFIEGRKQSEIAEEMNLSTSKVNRIIAQARRMGMVKIAIETPFQRLMDLEARLVGTDLVKAAIVSPTVSDNDGTRLSQVGQAAAAHLAETLRDGDILGISGGKAVAAVVDAMLVERPIDVQVVPLTGGVQGKYHTDVNHLASRMAERLGGRSLQLHAPLFAERADQREMLMNLGAVKEVLDLARRATACLVGIGSITTPGSSYFDLHPLSPPDRAMLPGLGVMAEFLGHLVHDRGQVANFALNQRLVALRPDEIRRCDRVVAVAAGDDKVGPVRSVLRGGYVSTLVTDEDTASRIVETNGASA